MAAGKSPSAIAQLLHAMQDFKGAEVLFGSVSDEASLASAFAQPADVVVSCLASRSGGKVSTSQINPS